jgi:hypothetical protein
MAIRAIRICSEPLVAIALGESPKADLDVLSAHEVGPDRAYRVLAYLAAYWNGKSRMTIPLSQTAIAEDLGFHRRTVRRTIDALAACGLIDVVGGTSRGRRTCYAFPWFTEPDSAGATPEVGADNGAEVGADNGADYGAGTRHTSGVREERKSQSHAKQATNVAPATTRPDPDLTDPNGQEAREWLHRFTLLTGIEIGHTKAAIAVARHAIAQGFTPARARDRLEQAGHNLNLIRAGAALKQLQLLEATVPDTVVSIADLLRPDICDEHGGQLRRLCPACKRQQATA